MWPQQGSLKEPLTSLTSPQSCFLSMQWPHTPNCQHALPLPSWRHSLPQNHIGTPWPLPLTLSSWSSSSDCTRSEVEKGTRNVAAWRQLGNRKCLCALCIYYIMWLASCMMWVNTLGNAKHVLQRAPHSNSYKKHMPDTAGGLFSGTYTHTVCIETEQH